MNSDLSGFLCLGSLCLLPIVMFVVGVMVGGNRLPYRVRLERNQRPKFEVDNGETEWK